MDDLGLLKPVCLFEQLFNQKLRINGAKLCDLGDFSCSTDVISTAAGSSIVTVGTTNVICGVKVKVLSSIVHETSPHQNLIVNVEHIELSHRVQHRGSSLHKQPQSRENQYLSVQLNSLLSTVAVPDARQQLEIQSQGGGDSGACYLLHVDVAILHDDGCLLDACLTACLAALSTARWPRLERTSTSGFAEDSTGATVNLKLSEWPIAVSFAIVPEISPIDQYPLRHQLISQPSRREILLWDTDASPCHLIIDSTGAVVDFCLLGGAASTLWSHLAGGGDHGDIVSQAIKRATEHATTVRDQILTSNTA